MADPILNPGEVEGTLRYTMETGVLYMDSGETRIEITDFVKGLTEAQIRATIQPLPKVYIAVDSKRLLVYDNDLEDWITIGGTGAVDWADNAGTASYAFNAGTATKAYSSDNATNAGTAVYSIEANHASTADYATNSGTADHAVLAETAVFALNGGTSTQSEHAELADTATYAVNSGTAIEANHAATATNANDSDHAINADTATYAVNAGTAREANHAASATHTDTATYAVNAGTAREANHAATATYALNGGTSTQSEHAELADTATYAVNAGTADYATKSSTATYAVNSGTASHAVHAGTADYATKSGTATYAVNAGTAVHAGTADYATKSGTAVEANHAASATHADTATYAVNSGTAVQAGHADDSDHAINADTATYAINAGTAVHAVHSSSADYATTALFALNGGTSSDSDHATYADTATYAVNSGTAVQAGHADDSDHAINADTATYAVNAGTAREANHASSATHADTATYAVNAGTAVHADTATYAATADYALVVNRALHANLADTATFALNGGTSSMAEKLANPVTIDGFQTDFSQNQNTITHYYICDTNADEAIKTVYANNIKLINGSRITVKFTKGNTCNPANLKLQLNFNDPKEIKYNGNQLPKASSIPINSIREFVYYNNYFNIIGDLDQYKEYYAKDGIMYDQDDGAFYNSGIRELVNSPNNGYITKNLNGTTSDVMLNAVHMIEHSDNGYIKVTTNGSSANLKLNAVHNINNSPNNGYIRVNTDGSTADVMLNAVHKIENSPTQGYMRVTTNGTTSDVLMNGVNNVVNSTQNGYINIDKNGSTSNVMLNAVHKIENSPNNGYMRVTTNGTTSDVLMNGVAKIEHGENGNIVVTTNGTTSNVMLNGVHNISHSPNNGYIRVNTDGSTSDILLNSVNSITNSTQNGYININKDGSTANVMLNAVHKIENSPTQGYIRVTTNGTTSDVLMNGVNNVVNSDQNGYINIDKNGSTSNVMLNAVHTIVNSTQNGYINIKQNGTTSNVMLNAVHTITNSTQNGYINIKQNGTTSNVMLNAVHKIENSPTQGYMRVTTNGTTSDVLMNGVSKVVKSGDNLIVTTNGTTSSITMDYAGRATDDESGNNIKDTYANSLSVSGYTLTLKNKNGGTLSTVNTTESKTIVGASNSAKANAAATDGNVFLNHIENDTVKSYHNIKGTSIAVTSDANGVIILTNTGVRAVANSSTNGYININTNGTTANVKLNAVHTIANSTTNGYININKNGTTSNIMLNAVHKIENSPTQGYMRVTTNGTTSDVLMNSVSSIVKSGDNLVVTTNGSTSSITLDYAGRATDDESGNNIKATYANSLSVSGYTLTLKNKNGGVLSTVNTTESKTIIGASNTAKANAAATDGNVFLNHIENDTVKSYHNIKGTGISVTSDANGVLTLTNTGVRAVANSSTNGYININTNGSTANVKLNAIHTIVNSSTNGYININQNGTTSNVMLNAVHKIATGATNGTINVTTNGSTAEVAVKGLKSAAYIDAATAATANTVVQRQANGYVYAAYFNQSSSAENATTASYIMYCNGDGFLRKGNISSIKTALSLGDRAYDSTSYLPTAGGTMSGNISFSNNGTAVRGIYGTMADNDGWRIVGAGTAANSGYLEIATKDDASEPIYVRQYTGDYVTLSRTATLLDASGNTSFPGTLTANKIDATKLDGTIPTACISGVRSITVSGNNLNVNTNGTTANITVPYATKAAQDESGNNIKTTYGASLSVSGYSVSLVNKNGTTLSTISTTESKTIIGASNTATANAAATNGNVFLNHIENGAVKSYHNIKGTSISVTSDANGVLTLTNSGVRAIAKSSVAGNINVNTNGTTANVEVLDAPKAVKSITRSGTTFTATCLNGSTFSFTQQDNDTKNTAGSTDTSSKIFLIGATSQAANPQTYSDDQVYVTSGTLQANILNATAGVNANTANSGSAGGLSLYSTTPTSYGIAMRNTGTSSGQLGKHGYVQGDWAGYFCFDGATNRGYVFRHASNNIASISGDGNAVFNGSVTVGGNSANTSGARMEYNTTNECIDFVFVA